MIIPVNLANEDELSEVVLRRLLDHVDRGFAIGAAYGRRGFGYLRSTIPNWNRAARQVPLIVLTDLDRHTCPAETDPGLATGTAPPQFAFPGCRARSGGVAAGG
ncbi:hypothetical protein SBA3_410042 [Candidatus Sulfopaludibacter sp. SbA3]|nr:hypothetical protein SBA3_410042 [Candidatus Sulfopaludibacter sp. SbA3]